MQISGQSIGSLSARLLEWCVQVLYSAKFHMAFKHKKRIKMKRIKAFHVPSEPVWMRSATWLPDSIFRLNDEQHILPSYAENPHLRFYFTSTICCYTACYAMKVFFSIKHEMLSQSCPLALYAREGAIEYFL